MRSKYCLLYAFFALCLVGGCTGQSSGDIATPIPTELLPTAIALTLQSKGVAVFRTADLSTTVQHTATVQNIATIPLLSSTPFITSVAQNPASNTPTIFRPTWTASVTPTATQTITPTFTVTAVLTATENVPLTSTLSITASTPFEISLPPPPLETPSLAIPEAHIQIYRLGELSLVTSPIQATLRLTARISNVIRIELFGEDGRLLARHVKTFGSVPWAASRIDQNIEFEISAVAELSRLVVSVEDQYGRLTNVNSVDLILLSAGMTKLNPASALWQRIIIQEPQPKALIQGGKLIVSGRARPNSDQPLRVMLVTEDGRIIGQRLAGVSNLIPGDYGTYVTEVSYSVSDLVFALLVVYEDGQPLSDIAHLSSTEVILAP